ncbi:ATP-binding protein [Streptomyces scopuliridis]|uniref:ATP-binding protein n=1 Tax=Streptomyces scopuliridis TaxID=452529 RepID=UPI00368ACE7D
MTPHQERGNTVNRQWVGHPRCVGMARGRLRETLEAWGLSALEDDACLVLSELLTNAAQHGGTPSGDAIQTRFVRQRGGLRVEVRDGSSEWPHRRTPTSEALSGRGLGIVEELSDRWGCWQRGECGKTVWAELSLPDGGLGHGR